MELRDHPPEHLAPPSLTAHARSRARERGIRREEIALVHHLGMPFHAGGRFRITLDGIARPTYIAPPLWSAAASVVIVETAEGRVVTVYRQSRQERSGGHCEDANF